MKRLASATDGSINWIIPKGNSFIECRYIRRADGYISSYLSSHSGCKMGCSFCYLTVTNQTSFTHVDVELFKEQLNLVLNHAKDIDGDKSKDVRINVNMMARGEALANKFIVNKYPEFYKGLNTIVDKYDYGTMKINISTIMPYTIKNHDLVDIFHDLPTNIYYSIYSINQKFRDKWIPNGIHWYDALTKLKKYQLETNNTITLHFALIENENDNPKEVQEMADEINNFNFTKLKFNIVRFNKHEKLNYNEAPMEKIEAAFDILSFIAKESEITTNKSRIVKRVAEETLGSCGMFYEPNI
jgi:adenine C2-methylase RlmN of 23S rRNA A2503 and tRNA A37